MALSYTFSSQNGSLSEINQGLPFRFPPRSESPPFHATRTGDTTPPAVDVGKHVKKEVVAKKEEVVTTKGVRQFMFIQKETLDRMFPHYVKNSVLNFTVSQDLSRQPTRFEPAHRPSRPIKIKRKTSLIPQYFRSTKNQLPKKGVTRMAEPLAEIIKNS